MNSELPVSADALLAERARLEEVLQSSEDWCELLRLKSRKDRGEGMSAVNAARLEMVLIDALAEDPDFIRYKAVCVALERLIRGLPPLPPKGEKPAVEKDDLTEIDGISASMQRRLNALDVTTFMQIAEWTNADVKSISSDLGLGRQIYEQDWIGQAEELATRSDAPVTAPPPPKPSATPAAPPPKQIVAERPAAPPPRPVEQRAAPVEKAPPPPQSPTVQREEPRPIIEARPEAKSEIKLPAKPIEATPEPVAAKPQTPAPAKVEEPTPKLVAPPSSDTKPEKSVDAQPAAIETAKPAEIAPAKAEQKTEIKAEVPVQAVIAKSDPARVQSPAPTLASSSAPLADPPRPLKPEIYRVPASVSDKAADVKADAASLTAKPQEPTPQQPKQQPKPLQSEALLPVPPSPLRVQQQQQPVAPSQVSPAPPPSQSAAKPSSHAPSSSAPASPAPVLVELPAPPKPLVITRASLPPRPKIEIPAAPPPAAQRQPEQPRPVAVSTAKPPSSAANSGPFAALAALKPAASTPPSSTPSMSIAEAIAYAAEVARQSPKTSSNGTGSNSASPSNAANAAVAAASAPPSQRLEPARPPVAAPQSPPPPKPSAAAPAPTPSVRAPAPAVVPAKPAVPPPLPEGFVPPPEDVETEQLDYRSARGLSSRNGGRHDSAGQRLYAEEATVEIVVKSAPDVVPTPRAALAKVATETTTATPAQRPATPIGRFLKALTGN